MTLINTKANPSCFCYEFYVRIEGKLPEHNTQVKPPEDQAQDPYSDGNLVFFHTLPATTTD